VREAWRHAEERCWIYGARAAAVREEQWHEGNNGGVGSLWVQGVVGATTQQPKARA